MATSVSYSGLLDLEDEAMRRYGREFYIIYHPGARTRWSEYTVYPAEVMPKDEFEELLWNSDWDSWVRVIAEDAEMAVRRFDDAYSQWRAREDGVADWQAIVLTPFEEREG